MSYKLKTLVVFDTNSLRSIESGEVAYSYFDFGRPFKVIEDFIIGKNLTDDIHIAVPTWAIEELKDQKQRQYKDDVVEFQRLSKRLSGLPHIGQITLPSAEFDCAAYVGKKATEYLSQKSVKLLEIGSDIANSVLRSMMTRVMKDEGKKAPFAHSGKYKDAGFKDNVVWESLMNFNDVTTYDKIIFICKDGDFNKHCENEFRSKWQKHITIEKDENNVIAEIAKDYGNYIAERAIHDFTHTEYFGEYLFKELKSKSAIVIGSNEYAVENFSIRDLCKNVDRLPPNEGGVENLLISSIINVFYTANGGKAEQIVEVLTMLGDDETKEIISTEYDCDLK